MSYHVEFWGTSTYCCSQCDVAFQSRGTERSRILNRRVRWGGTRFARGPLRCHAGAMVVGGFIRCRRCQADHLWDRRVPFFAVLSLDACPFPAGAPQGTVPLCCNLPSVLQCLPPSAVRTPTSRCPTSPTTAAPKCPTARHLPERAPRPERASPT